MMDIQIEEWIDRWMDGQINEYVNGIGKEMDDWIDRWKNGQMDGWTDKLYRWIGRQMDRQIDEWRQIEEQINGYIDGLVDML